MLCSALEESRPEARQKESGPGDPGLDLVLHLDHGEEVHLHSLVLAASSQYFNILAKVSRETHKHLNIRHRDIPVHRKRKGRKILSYEILLDN